MFRNAIQGNFLLKLSIANVDAIITMNFIINCGFSLYIIVEFLLFICIFIKIFTFENYEEPFIVKVSYCHIKLVGGNFRVQLNSYKFWKDFCSVVTYYLLTTIFFFGKRPLCHNIFESFTLFLCWIRVLFKCSICFSFLNN